MLYKIFFHHLITQTFSLGIIHIFNKAICNVVVYLFLEFCVQQFVCCFQNKLSSLCIHICSPKCSPKSQSYTNTILSKEYISVPFITQQKKIGYKLHSFSSSFPLSFFWDWLGPIRLFPIRAQSGSFLLSSATGPQRHPSS